jgi:predicted dehydrogenase
VLKNNKDFQLVGIASSGGLHAQHSGKKFGFQYATSSEDEIINDKNINTVAILTRHDSHADLVVKGAEGWQACVCGETAGDQ